MYDPTPYLPLINYLSVTVHGRPAGLTTEQWIDYLAQRFVDDPAFQQAVAELAAEGITEALVAQAFPDFRHLVDQLFVPVVTAATQKAIRRLQRRMSPAAIWGWAAVAALLFFAIWADRKS